MRIQTKQLLLVFLVLLATISAVVWKSRALLIKDKLNFIADSSMKQIAPLKRLVQQRLDEQKSKLVKFAAGRATHGSGAMRVPEGYDVAALVQLGSDQQWSPAWMERGPQPKADLAQGLDLTVLKSLPFSKVKDGETYMVRVSDRRGSPLYAVMVSVEVLAPSAQAQAPTGGTLPESVDYSAAPSGSGRKAVVVGLTAAGPLTDVADDFIGSTNTVYLIDDKGYVAAHVNKAYLGELFTEDPIVEEIVKKRKTAASGNYEDLESRAVLGHFEKIDRTNLYAVITTPLAATQALVGTHVRTSLVAGAAVAALGLILTWLFGRTFAQPLNEAIEAIRALNRGEAFHVRSSESRDEIGTLMRLLSESSPTALASKANWGQPPGSQQAGRPAAGQDEKREAAPSQHAMRDEDSNSSKVLAVAASQDQLAQARKAAYQSFNDGFSAAIKEPLLAILGHAQLAKGKSEPDEMRAHAESIEREARRAKEFLERLQGWGEKSKDTVTMQLKTMDVSSVIEEVLAERESQLSAEGIHVSKEIHAVPRVRGSEEEFKVVLANVIDNAREAMRARPKKLLRIQLDFLNDRLYLVVSDTGIGMTRDVKERAFEPFFKGFDSHERVGLGLALVQSSVTAIGGCCTIDSTPGEGASMTIKLPVTADEKQAFRISERNMEAASQSASEAVTTPLAPPPLPSSATKTKVVARAVEAAVSSEPPAGASVADPVESSLSASDHVAEEDDDEEGFKSVSLVSQVRNQLENETDEGFKVKIRRPKLRS